MSTLSPQKLWLDLDGTLIPVQDSHEEWANARGHELETLLEAGWVRIQNVPPSYLYIDFRITLNASQAVCVRVLFENQFELVVVEFRGESRSFTDKDDALRHARTRGLTAPV
jgi:hypothetical protein